jgi:hypothetical protein
MAIIGIKVDTDKPRAALADLRSEQLPWTIARALTKTAQDAQAAGRKLAGSVFRLRNDWTVRNIKIKAATKNQLMSVVLTDTCNAKTGAPDYLPPQEDGGEKVPLRGRLHIAIPSTYLRQITNNGPIPDKYRPRTMLQFAQIGPPTKKEMRKRRAAIRDGWYYFLQTLSSGAHVIMGRYVADARDQARVFYLLVTEANIRRRFPLQDTAIDVVDQRWPENFKQAAIETMANDLLRGSGLRVKF